MILRKTMDRAWNYGVRVELWSAGGNPALEFLGSGVIV